MNVSCLVACSAVSREMDIVRLPYPNYLPSRIHCTPYSAIWPRFRDSSGCLLTLSNTFFRRKLAAHMPSNHAVLGSLLPLSNSTVRASRASQAIFSRHRIGCAL
jgi:hypothetical protein